MEVKIKVGAIICNENDEILLIKEYSEKKKGFFWNIVKGTMDIGDKQKLHTLERELFEEVGLIKGSYIVKGLFGLYESKRSDYISSLFVYNVYSDKLNNYTLNNNAEDEIINSFDWFSLDALNTMNENDFFDTRIYKIIQDYNE